MHYDREYFVLYLKNDFPKMYPEITISMAIQMFIIHTHNVMFVQKTVLVILFSLYLSYLQPISECVFEGQPYQSGDEFLSPRDPCETCICIVSKHLDLSCPTIHAQLCDLVTTFSLKRVGDHPGSVTVCTL